MPGRARSPQSTCVAGGCEHCRRSILQNCKTAIFESRSRNQESHTNEVSGAGTVSLNVELDPELWCELTDGVGVGTSLVGRVVGGDIEWAALRVWREFQQADKVNTLAVEEAIVLLCEMDGSPQTCGRRTRLRTPIRVLDGGVHFAGEHISAWPYWMQGALQSGLRAAKEVNDA